MAFNLNGVLSLNSSSFSSGIKAAISSLKGLKSSSDGAKDGVKGVGDGMDKIKGSASNANVGVKELVKGLAGLKAVSFVADKAVEGIKTGFSQAFDLQGYRTQLQTATKDTKKAGKLMSGAIEYANQTPFETGEVVQATAQLEAYGISSEQYIKDIGDMAGATNKSMMQATEALADASTGEFERLKEFGMTKDMIVKKSEELFGEMQAFDKKGSMIDQAKAMETIQTLMQEKFKGGAEMMSKTVKGMWSTITGVAKIGLASIVGISTAGETAGQIIEGSLLDKVNTGVTFLAEKLQGLQSSGFFTNIGAGISGIFDGLQGAIEFLAPFADTLISTFQPIISDVFGVLTDVVIPKLSSAFQSVIPTLGSIFVNTCSAISGAYHNIIVPVFDAFAPLISGVVDTIGGIISNLLSVFDGLTQFISGVFAGDWDSAWQGIKNAFSAVVDGIKGLINGIIDTVTALPRAVVGAVKNIKNAVTGGGGGGGKGKANANGTSYFTGGTTAINERGGEMQILPSGTSIIPADRTKQMIEGNKSGGGHSFNIEINAVDMTASQIADTLVPVLMQRIENM